MVRDHFTVCCEMIFAVISLQFAVIILQFAVIDLQFAVISLQQQIDPDPKPMTIPHPYLELILAHI